MERGLLLSKFMALDEGLSFGLPPQLRKELRAHFLSFSLCNCDFLSSLNWTVFGFSSSLFAALYAPKVEWS